MKIKKVQILNILLMKELLRIGIAIIFILSGLVKAIDIRGFSFKLEEYFSPAVFNLPFFETNSLPIAIFVVLGELLLGITLLLKIRLKATLISLIGLCIFFAFLTFYSAYFNKVTDCGCFGDAIKFTPWQSFWKDIILLLGLLILWKWYKNDISTFDKTKKIGLIAMSLVFGYIMIYGMVQEPIVDFRDYKIGVDIKSEKNKIAKNPSEYKTFYTLKNKNTGVEKEVHQDDYVNTEEYWKDGSPWEIMEDKTTSKLVKEGYKSEISKFKIEDSIGNDLTDRIINSPKMVLVFSYKPQAINKEKNKIEIKKLQDQYKAEFIGVSTLPNTFENLPNATMDGTAIKTIARSNPFILVLENGKIIDKKPLK